MSDAATITPPANPGDQGAPPATPAAPAAPATPGSFLGDATKPTDAKPSTPPPAHFFGDHVAKDGVFLEGWSEQLRAAGFERLANKAQLAKDESTLFRTLDETIGFVGKKQIGPAWPTAESTPEEVAAFRKAAGVPPDSAGYVLKPEKLPEGMEWSDSDAAAYAEVFHRHNVPQAAAQELVDRHLETIANMANEGKDRIMQRIGKFAEASEATFQKEWGDEYDTRLEANRAFVTTRFSAEELADPVIQAALSHPAIVRMVDTARRELRGATSLPGTGAEQATGSMSPRQQAFALMQADPAWQKNPDKVQRINDLYALDAAQAKRKK